MSSIIGLLGGIAGFVKVRYLHDKAIIDNPVFRLHYRVTSAFFFATCILITAFDLFGKPIDCITSFPFSRPDALNTYCWTHSTFTLVRNTSGIHPTAHPNVGPQFSGDEKRYHSYYQWVPFVLFLQGILFYLPHWIWKQVESGKIRNITEGCRGHNLGDPTGRQTRCSAVSIYLRETLYSHGRFATAYITCEVLNFVNTLGNMFLINKFLNGAFMRYGSKVIQFSEEDPEFRFDPMIEVFPRMTKCTFHQFGPSGTIQILDAQCILPHNIVNEKIYIFLWFWLIFLLTASALALVYRALTFLVPATRVYGLDRITSPGKAKALAVLSRLPYGDFFLLHMLSKNLQGFLFNGIVDELSELTGCQKRALKTTSDKEKEEEGLMMQTLPAPMLTKYNITE